MNTANHPAFKKESTGDRVFDELLGGGIPSRSLVVLAGEPGSGKTILTLQMLFGAAKRGRKGLYFTTFSEPAVKVIGYMQLFEFFDEQLLDRDVVLADLGAAIRDGGERVLDELEHRVEALKPDFVAIDSFKALTEMLSSGRDARALVSDLAVRMAGWGVTTFLVGEYTRDELATVPEAAVADGIIRLGSERFELTSVREVEILKLRGAGYRSGRHFFDITKSGLVFYPRVGAPTDTGTQQTFDPSVRVPTGIQGLDELLHGGIPAGSATLVQGASGTGKTMLGMQFLIDGAKRGERGVLFTLEETPDQLRGIGAALGWDLEALERSGHLRIEYTSPVELSTDRFLYRAHEIVRERAAARAVFDSLSTMSLGVASPRRFKEMVYAIAKHLRGANTALVMTIEPEQTSTHGQVHGISLLADNVIQLRYMQVDDHLDRGISVLKARGIKHESTVRPFSIAKGGLHVKEVDDARSARK